MLGATRSNVPIIRIIIPPTKLEYLVYLEARKRPKTCGLQPFYWVFYYVLLGILLRFIGYFTTGKNVDNFYWVKQIDSKHPIK